MTDKPNHKTRSNKFTPLLAFGSLAAWGLIVETGTRLPFVYTLNATQLRAYLIFPAVLLPFIYFAFVYRKRKGRTGFQQALDGLSTKNEKIKIALLGIAGTLLIPAGIAWTSIAFAAWAAELFASTPYNHAYYISDINLRSGPKWSALFDLEMSSSTSSPVTLRLNRPRYERNHWRAGEWICVIGRTSIFGTIVDDSSRHPSGHRCSAAWP